ncbi:IS3 family transposase, partial [Escherichia coli]|uniref:IS3 family transposase n=1 Tax=Escherichia coli TaxID=562 RepID=UPI001F0B166B
YLFNKAGQHRNVRPQSTRHQPISLAGSVRNLNRSRIKSMCYLIWVQQPHSQRHQADLRLTGQIKQFWLESGCVYGYRKIHLDLRDSGQQCGVNRVWRLMKRVGIKAQVGYRSPRARKGEASIVSPNRLQRQFNPDAPDERWVTDITYSVPGVQG